MSRDHDDEGLRPDWRDAEFGGPFPDTMELKVLVTTVRNRVQRVWEIINAPRPTRAPEIFMGLADRPRVDETCCAVR